MKYFSHFLPILIILIVSFFTIRPLFAAGFFSMHDDTQVARVYEMKTSLADGMFPVRWVPDLGYNYGYPLFNFYGPFAYYVGGFFNLAGFNSLVATKIMIGLGILLAGIGMYLFARDFWGEKGAILSALLYIYAPYHAVNIYVRGAIGELWGYALIPFVFFGLYRVYLYTYVQKNNMVKETLLWGYITVTAVSYACLIAAHNLTAMMVTPFFFVVAFFLYGASRYQSDTKKSYFILLALLLGLFLAGFYWLPVLFEMKYTNVVSDLGGGSDYRDHFVCLQQLWDSPWGFGGSGPGCVDGLSFRLGKLHIILALLAFVPLYLYRSRKNILFALSGSILGALFSIFLMINTSQFIWDAIPHMAFFQFPWRFLVLAMFFLSFLGGAISLVLKKLPKQSGVVVIGVLIIGILLLNIKLFVPGQIVNKTADDYTQKSVLTWETSRISDEYMPPGFQKPKTINAVPKQKIVSTNDIKLVSYTEKTQSIEATVHVSKQTDIPVSLAYFPSWHVFIDGERAYFKYYKKGLLVTVPQGVHTITIAFIQTSVERIGNILSLTGVFILIAGIISSRKERKRV